MNNGARNAVFLDTNVLIYARATRSPFHQAAREALQGLYDAEVELWISRQVLREYLAALTRPQQFTNPLPMANLSEDIRLFQTPFRIAEDIPKVTERLFTLLEEIPPGGRQVYDANIVATMLVYGIEELLTNNVQYFNRFSQLITVVPPIAPGEG
jgi:predicted nucleic acid-binding protein